MKKINFEVTINLSCLERKTPEEVEELIVGLIKNAFKSGRVKAK